MMSKDLNQCNFIGRLGKDPEIRYMPSGGAAANFSIACGDDYKDKNTGEKVDKTNWINIVAYRRLAEIIGEYCKKGDQVFISGKYTTRKWQDQNGQDRYTTEIIADNMQMLGSKNNSQQQNQQQAQQPAQQAGTINNDFDDDIDF